jgi:hypothetical protein
VIVEKDEDEVIVGYFIRLADLQVSIFLVLGLTVFAGGVSMQEHSVEMTAFASEIKIENSGALGFCVVVVGVVVREEVVVVSVVGVDVVVVVPSDVHVLYSVPSKCLFLGTIVMIVVVVTVWTVAGG